MYCPSCGNEISVELKYCNRCGANLSLPTATATTVLTPIKLTVPSIVLGLTVVGGLGIVFAGAAQFAAIGIHPVALIWITLFGTAAVFGCTALMIRFWLRLLALQRDALVGPSIVQPGRATQFDKPSTPTQLPPRFEGVPSVTENTTRTFTPVYREQSDR